MSIDSEPDRNYPRGLEILLKKASVDEDFAKVLLESPEEAARLISLDLQDSERRILLDTPRTTLETMIRHTTLKRQELSAFKTMSASLMLAAVIPASSPGSRSGSDRRRLRIQGTTVQGDPAQCRIDLATMQAALEAYAADHDGFVSTADWHGPNNPLTKYLSTGTIPYDPWANPYHYEGVEEGGTGCGLSPEILRP